MKDAKDWCLNCEALTESLTTTEENGIMLYTCAICKALKGKKLIEEKLDGFFR